MTIWSLIENEKAIIKIALHEKNNGNTIRLYVWILPLNTLLNKEECRLTAFP